MVEIYTDPDQQALDVGPDTAEWRWSERIRIHNTNCVPTNSFVFQFGEKGPVKAKPFGDK